MGRYDRLLPSIHDVRLSTEEMGGATWNTTGDRRKGSQWTGLSPEAVQRAPLCPREREVLACIGRGLSNSQIAADSPLPLSGKVFVSVKNRDKRLITVLAQRLADLGFSLVATQGTAKVLGLHGLEVEVIHKVAEGYRPNVLDLMRRGDIALLLNTPEDGRARQDSYLIRRTAVMRNIPYYTTPDGAQAAIGAIEAMLKREHTVRTLQEYHREG